ncbi:MAG: amino acid adenylation domain-containing protein [Candidatus Aminicenantes bacterium]|jgi:amino acid adenylation domain-containing protein
MEQDIFIPLDKFEDEKEYWLSKLSGKLNQIRLLKDFPEENNYQSARVNGHIETEVFQEIMRMSKGNDLSLFVFLLSCFKILLFKYTGQNEIIVSSPTYSTGSQRYNPMVVFRDFVNPGMTFKELLLKVKQTVAEGYKNQSLPIKQLINLLSIENPDSRESLFRIIFLLKNIHDREPVRKFIQDIESDIIFSLRRTDRGLETHVTYNAGLFKKETISGLLDSFSRILSQVSGWINISIKDIEVIAVQEKAEILNRFNSTRVDYPGEKSVHGLFARQVEITPDNTALYLQDHHFTYYMLHRLSAGIACFLKEKGVGANFIVGLMMRNSLEMVIAILGILKAGGAYLPLDPDYPQERQHYLILDSHMKILLVDTSPGETALSNPAFRSVSIFSLCHMDLAGYRDRIDNPCMPASVHNPAHLAYVVYTSGTTGNPKGVLVQHGGIVNYINWRLNSYRYTGRDVTLQLLSYCFDGFVSNFYSSLLSGGILIIIPDDRKLDYDYIGKIIKMRCVTNTSLVPGMYEALLDTAGTEDLVSIRFVVLAGERANSDLLYKNKKRYPNIKHINEYGPTEGTVTAAANTNMNTESTSIIGKPISNTRIYIFAIDGKLVPVGVSGELAIQGVGVSRGYINRPMLTAEKFVLAHNSELIADRETMKLAVKFSMSYQLSAISYIYKTGDLARWLPDGNIEFLGRIDHQVKIRGYRIELEEIENQLLQHRKIKASVVIARDDALQRKPKKSDKYLCAYITAGEKLNTDELRDFLSEKLPGYMLPSYFLQVEQIPLTANGKVDCNALPVPKTGVQFKAPRNETEDKLAQIWSQILDIEKCPIGIDDNFFQLGGHSLKITSLAAKIHREFDVKIPLTDLFKIRTIRELSQYIDGSKKEPFTSIAPVEERDFYELSPAQKRMYILHRMIGHSTAYNIPGVIMLEGRIEKQKFNTSLKKLITRHESLRTSFKLIEGKPVQKVHKNVNFEIEYYDINEVEVEKEKQEKQVTGKNPPYEPPDPKSQELKAKTYINSFIRPFDLSQAPLLRVGLIRPLHPPAALRSHPRQATYNSQEGKKGKYLLMVDMHHIIADGMSIEVFLQDFTVLYSGQELPALRLQYKDFAQWQRNPRYREALEEQEIYWLKLFETVPPPLELPTDFPRPSLLSYEGSSLEFSLGKKETRLLKSIARVEGATLFMVLLAIYTILLSRLTGRHDIVVGAPIIGRRHADLENIVGIFINALALRNHVPSELTFIEFLREVKRNTLKAFENQDYPFEDLVEKVLKHRHSNRNSLFDVRFNMDSFEILPEGFGKLKLKPYPLETTTSKFDMTLNAREAGEILSFGLQYCSKLFKKTTIEKFIGYFREITTAVAENPGIKLEDIKLSLDLSWLETGMEMDRINIEF